MIGNRVRRAIVPVVGNRSSQRRILTESKLSDLDASDLGFPAYSIVFVRHLRPGPEGWPDLRSQGRRPALDGHIPDSAGVVWFLDSVEWLACLGRAAVDSRLDRWWWRTLRPGSSDSDPVLDAFLRHLPEGRLAWSRLESAGLSQALEIHLGTDGIARLETAWTESGLAGRTHEERRSDRRPPNPSPAAPHPRALRIQPSVPGNLPEPATDPVLIANRGSAAGKTPPEPELVVFTPSKADPAPIQAPSSSVPKPDSTDPPIFTAGRLTSQEPLGERDSEQIAPSPTASVVPEPKRSIEPAPPDRKVRQTNPPIVHSPNADRATDSDPVASLASAPARLFESEFAGLFFVLGALQALGWIPDFTRPLDPGIGTHPLEYLARLGVQRFGKRFRRDPLREWLASRFPSGGPEDAPPRLAELESRIGLALDMRPRAAVHFLCRRRAAILASESRIDVFHRLDDHPLGIRMAGLDRDPGWIPGTCLDFRFHFGSGRP